MMAAIDDPTAVGHARPSFADQHDIDEFVATLEQFEREGIGPDQWLAQRAALEIILAGDKLGSAALVEGVHRAYLPARVLAFAEDVPIGEGRHPVDGRPAAYVCRNRTWDAPVTNVKALLEHCAA